MLRRRRGSLIPPPDLRIVLLGKTGSGKSSTGNTILSGCNFTTGYSMDPVTSTCQKHKANVGGRNISIIDTPGLFDTSITNEELKSEIKKCVEMSAPGPHVFLLVMRLDVRFTDEEKNAVKWIQENFGKDAIKYTIILFTHADILKAQSLHEYVDKSKNMQAVISQYSGRYHSFNNDNSENQDQVTQLLNMVDEMVKDHGGDFYTNQMFEKTQRKILLANVAKTAATLAVDIGLPAVAGLGAAVRGGKAAVAATVAAAGIVTAAKAAYQ